MPGVFIEDNASTLGCECPDGELPIGIPTVWNPPARVCSGVPRGIPYNGCNVFGCPEATVCVDNANDGPLGCNRAASCLFAYVFHDVARPESACMYADFTTAETGVVPGIACAADIQAAGLCGLGCPCLDGNFVCYGHSEQHPTGTCVTREIHDHCFPFNSEPEYCGTREPERPICLFPAVIPDWMAASERATARSSAGRCVTVDACAALQAAQPGVWRCIAPGGAEL
jgi:hypothetical protein